MVTLCESVGLKQCRVCEEWLDAEDVDENGACAGCEANMKATDEGRKYRRDALMAERADPEKFAEAERQYNEHAWRIYAESNGQFGWSDHEWQPILKPVNNSQLMWQA